MNTPARLTSYTAAVVLLSAGAFAVGNASGVPTDHLRPAARSSGHNGHAGTGAGESQQAAPESAQPTGLSSSKDGYTIEPVTTALTTGKTTEFAFRITGPDGKPVTDFKTEHEKRLHLILVRGDTAGFQHLHPTMSEDGIWRAPVTLQEAGTYRAFADFFPAGGETMTLGVNLFAGGDFEPMDVQPSRTATLADGYQVTLNGDLAAGESSMITLTVTRDGRPVTDLQPYLGAYGHLVALRASDLGYLHVHPDGSPVDGDTSPGPRIAFHAEVPTTGTYRLFLDFRHEGEVRTAEFTVPAAADTAASKPPAHTPAEDGHDDSPGGH